MQRVKIFTPHRILLGRSNQGKGMGVEFCTHIRLFKKPIYRWRDNIKTALQEIYWKDVDWVHVAELPQEFLDMNMKFRHHKTCKVSRIFK